MLRRIYQGVLVKPRKFLKDEKNTALQELNLDIWFDVTKYKFIVKNSSFKMLVVFSPIFVTDTKITFVYNFVAPLTRFTL